jgi:type VI secretion system Hcp family effector
MLLPGPIKVPDKDNPLLTGCYGEEFEHHVYTIPKDYFYALLYSTDFVRKHEPMVIVKQLDKMSVPLISYMTKGEFLKKVEVRWYKYNKTKSKNEEYFRMTLENVRLHSVEHNIPDTKDRAFERYGHLEKIKFMYKKITWLYTKGYLTHTDIWNDAFSEDDGMVSSIEELIEAPVLEPLKLKFTSGFFQKSKESLAIGKKALINFNFNSNRVMTQKENKVYAKLYAIYKGKIEDMHRINEGRLTKDNSWSTEFNLIKPDKYIAGTPIEYYAVIENASADNNNFKSDSISFPPKVKGYVHVCCMIFGTEEVLKNVECTLKEDNGDKEFKATTNDKGEVSWKDLSLDTYTVSVTAGEEIYSAPVRWQNNNKSIQKLKLKNKKTIFVMDEGIKGGEHASLCIQSLSDPNKILGKKCIIKINKDRSSSDIIAEFETVIERGKEEDTFYFSPGKTKRIDNFLHTLPEEEKCDPINGTAYLAPLKVTPSFFYLCIDSGEAGDPNVYPILLQNNIKDSEFAVYKIGFTIELDGATLYSSKQICYIDCNNLFIENCKNSAMFIVKNHYQNVIERKCGTHYGRLYPYTFKNEEEYQREAASRSLNMSKYKGMWDQKEKDRFDLDKKRYSLTYTDCIQFVTDALIKGFKKTGLYSEWDRCKKRMPSGEGHELAAGLTDLGWVAIYYSPDVVNYYDKDPKHNHSTSYKQAIEKRQYGNLNNKPIIPLTDIVVNYRPTVRYQDQTMVENPITADTTKLKKILEIPFAYLIGEYGRHTALLIGGDIIAVHWAESPYSDYLYEGDHRKFSHERKEKCWNWLDGIIVTPKAFWNTEYPEEE